MKKILVFANESQIACDIIQSLLAKNFQVQVLTFRAFKKKDIIVNAKPLQLGFTTLNISNYYNWKHDITKYDVVINLLTYEDFTSSQTNQDTIFTNFAYHFGDFTKNIGKKVIYLSPICFGDKTSEAELKMLENNSDIFYAKYGFLFESHNNFLTSILNSSCIFLPNRILKSKINVTTYTDVISYIHAIIDNNYNQKKVVISGECFTVRDIITICQRYSESSKIIKIPNFFFKILLFKLKFVPKNFYPKYLYRGYIAKLLDSSTKPNFQKYPVSTLLSKVIEQHAHNIFHPEIE